jgi:hypothetical protein
MESRKKLEAYLRRIVDANTVDVPRLLSAGQARLEIADPDTHGKVLESWERFAGHQPLSPNDYYHLEAIILLQGLRPIFDIASNSFPSLPEPWLDLNTHRAFLETCIRGIGRVEIKGRPGLTYAGTAFVVGENLLLTNRHVAESFIQNSRTELSFIPGIVASIDLLQEIDSQQSLSLNIVEPVIILDKWDAAMFRVDHLPNGVRPLPLAATPPPSTTGRLATIVGYPALDPNTSVDQILQQIDIFHSVFNKKRLQPGRIIGTRAVESYGRTVEALAHDCSTLGGNSGSALIDIQSQIVVGLHFAGEYLTANYAVPSWELGSIPSIRAAAVLFRDP